MLGIDFRRGTFVSSSSNWNIWVKDEFAKILGYFEPRQRFQRLALRFIRDKFRNEPFLAVHWRRGDRSAADPSEGMKRYRANNAERITEFLLPLLAKYKLRNVFLMTNSGNAAELAYISSHLPNVQQMHFAEDPLGYAEYTETDVSERWRFAQEEAMLQILISVQSSVFVGHGIDYASSSGVSRYTYFLRLRAGKSEESFVWRGLN